MPKEATVFLSGSINLRSIVATESIVFAPIRFFIIGFFIVGAVVRLDAVFSIFAATFQSTTALFATSRPGVGTTNFGLFALGTAPWILLVGISGSLVATITTIATGTLILDAVLALVSAALEAGAAHLCPIISRLCTAIGGLFTLGTAATIAEETKVPCGSVIARSSAKMVMATIIAYSTNVRKNGGNGQRDNGNVDGCDLHC